MSTTLTKRPLSEALADAMAFRELFPAWTYARWEIAGSVRRRKLEVGDVEHVVIPRFGDVPGELFPRRVNLLFHFLDQRIGDAAQPGVGMLTKHFYGDQGPRWGPINRGVDFRGFNHEFFSADEENWGSKLAIYTGPAEFSQRLVIGLRDNGYANCGGYVVSMFDWVCASRHRFPQPMRIHKNDLLRVGASVGGFTFDPGGKDGGPWLARCPVCGRDTLAEPVRVAALSEEDFFRCAGMKWIPAESRQ